MQVLSGEKRFALVPVVMPPKKAQSIGVCAQWPAAGVSVKISLAQRTASFVAPQVLQVYFAVPCSSSVAGVRISVTSQ